MPDQPLFHAVLDWEMPLPAPPDRVFPLLCPVREADWIPGWQAEVLHSASGVAELGCVFRTVDGDGTRRTWTVTRHEAEAGRLQFVQFIPDRAVLRLDLALEPRPGGCLLRWTYTVAALAAGPDALFEAYGEAAFAARMARLGELLGAHLRRTAP
jgi:hypothetical protein